jgi:hypothetical protein
MATMCKHTAPAAAPAAGSTAPTAAATDHWKQGAPRRQLHTVRRHNRTACRALVAALLACSAQTAATGVATQPPLTPLHRRPRQRPEPPSLNTTWVLGSQEPPAMPACQPLLQWLLCHTHVRVAKLCCRDTPPPAEHPQEAHGCSRLVSSPGGRQASTAATPTALLCRLPTGSAKRTLPHNWRPKQRRRHRRQSNELVIQGYSSGNPHTHTRITPCHTHSQPLVRHQAHHTPARHTPLTHPS